MGITKPTCEDPLETHTHTCEDPGVVFRVVVVLPTEVTRPRSMIGALNVPDEMHEISLV